MLGGDETTDDPVIADDRNFFKVDDARRPDRADVVPASTRNAVFADCHPVSPRSASDDTAAAARTHPMALRYARDTNDAQRLQIRRGPPENG
jgi:hypothetical protein